MPSSAGCCNPIMHCTVVKPLVIFQLLTEECALLTGRDDNHSSVEWAGEEDTEQDNRLLSFRLIIAFVCPIMHEPAQHPMLGCALCQGAPPLSPSVELFVGGRL